jgi:hypothetical protein
MSRASMPAAAFADGGLLMASPVVLPTLERLPYFPRD